MVAGGRVVRHAVRQLAGKACELAVAATGAGLAKFSTLSLAAISQLLHRHPRRQQQLYRRRSRHSHRAARPVYECRQHFLMERGGAGAAGIYALRYGALGKVADSNTAVPGGVGTFFAVPLPMGVSA